MYHVFTGKYPFHDVEDQDSVPEKVKAGERPKIPISLQHSSDPFDQALLQVIRMSWIQDPETRATARDIHNFITSELERLGVEKDS